MIYVTQAFSNLMAGERFDLLVKNSVLLTECDCQVSLPRRLGGIIGKIDALELLTHTLAK